MFYLYLWTIHPPENVSMYKGIERTVANSSQIIATLCHIYTSNHSLWNRASITVPQRSVFLESNLTIHLQMGWSSRRCTSASATPAMHKDQHTESGRGKDQLPRHSTKVSNVKFSQLGRPAYCPDRQETCTMLPKHTDSLLFRA